MLRRKHPPLWSSVRGLAVVATMAVALGGPAVVSAADPLYRVDVTPDRVAAGTQPTFQVTLTHLADTTREIGSARITPPSDIQITSATAQRGSNTLPVTVTSGSVIIGTVNLNDNHETATVTIHTSVPCGSSGSHDWAVVAIKNQTFDGGATPLPQDPTSQLTTQVVRCSLDFATQPASAEVDTPITSVAADPSGTAVKVRLLDGHGDPASQSGVSVSLGIASGTGSPGASIAGTVSATTNGNGVASFAPRIDRAGHDYRLSASAASGISAAADSSPFDISDVAVVCSGPCSGSSEKGDTSAVVSADSNGVLSFSLGLDGVECNDSVNQYYVSNSKVITFDVTTAVGRTTVTITLDAASVTKTAKKYEVCFRSPTSPFVNKFGASIAAGQAGLLPACPKRLSNAPPCLVSRDRDRDGNVIVQFSVPTGDPQAKI
jgi:hypothetical protein